MQTILLYIENHSGLFVALGSMAAAVTALIGLYFQYRKIKNENLEFKEAIFALQKDKEKLVANEAKLDYQVRP